MHQPYFPLNLTGWTEQEFVCVRGDGINPFLNYAGVFQGNPVGGMSHATAYSHEIVFGAELNLQRYLGLPGGSLIVSGINATGDNLSEDIGNLFTVSQAYTSQTILLSNLALRLEWFDRKFELRLGRMASGQFFARLPAFDLQVTGGINGNPNSLYTNIPFTTSAGPTWGGYAKFLPTPTTYASAGVFQASSRSSLPSAHGVDFTIRKGDGVLVLVETGWFPTFGTHRSTDGKGTDDPGYPGIYKVGAYYSAYTFTNYLGGTESTAYGFYGMGQQMVWRGDDPDHHFSFWGGFVLSPQQSIALTPLMGFVGAVWQGAIPTRSEDQILLTVLSAGYGDNYAKSQERAGVGNPTHETVVEVSYLFQVTKQIAIQPDLQWILNPGGTGRIPNALVLGVQVSASF